jgi:hypothetical protein
MTADQLVERGAERLEELAGKAERRGGLATKLAEPLSADAEFLRKLKPSLVKARAKGKAPTDQSAGGTPDEPRPSPSGAPPGAREAPKRARRGGPNPFVVAGVALAAGVMLAKWIDWRGHAHPRG